MWSKQVFHSSKLGHMSSRNQSHTRIFPHWSSIPNLTDLIVTNKLLTKVIDREESNENVYDPCSLKECWRKSTPVISYRMSWSYPYPAQPPLPSHCRALWRPSFPLWYHLSMVVVPSFMSLQSSGPSSSEERNTNGCPMLLFTTFHEGLHYFPKQGAFS